MITLIPMPDTDYEAWKEYGIAEFAKDKQRTHGYTMDEALKLSRNSFEGGLPDGLKTKDQYIFNIHDSGDQVIGTCWFAINEDYGLRKAFIYDIEIVEGKRGNGYGRAAMLAMEETIKSQGITKVGLHVFGFNKAAYALYQSLGYGVTDISMEKEI